MHSARYRASWKGTLPPPWVMIETQPREILEDPGFHQLHERRRVGVQVVGAGRVECRVARGGCVQHGCGIELLKLLVERIPGLVAERRPGPEPAGWIGVQIAPDEAELLDAALELLGTLPGTHTGRLRQRAHANEAVGIQLHRPVDQIVVDLRPVPADERVAEVMPHGRRHRGKQHDVNPALVQQPDLSLFEGRADFVVADGDRALRRAAHVGDLKGPEDPQPGRHRGVVAVRIDDHGARIYFLVGKLRLTLACWNYDFLSVEQDLRRSPFTCPDILNGVSMRPM